jgi:hypothetical protein
MKVKSKLRPRKPAFKKAPNVPQDKTPVANAKQKVMDDNMNTKVGRVLRANMESFGFDSLHTPFAARFIKNILTEAETPATPAQTPAPAADVNQQKQPSEFTPEGDKQAFDDAMEPETDKTDFDIKGVSPEVTSETITKIKNWSGKLDQFAEFLNDPEAEDSLHKILADGDRAGSLLRGVTRKASDSITRIAGEVEKLKEILNTYIITAPKKLRDTESQVAGWTQY